MQPEVSPRMTEIAEWQTMVPSCRARRCGSVPGNHPAEGLLRGPGLFLGYVDERDNEASLEEDRYLTGDLVEVSDQRLTVVGCLKEVVNRNGFKIPLNEVDAVLHGAPGVEEYSSFGVSDGVTGEHLVVAVVPAAGKVVTFDGLLEHLRASGLAIHKLPEEVVLWDEPLWRTASGKVIRSRLVMESPGKETLLGERLRAH